MSRLNPALPATNLLHLVAQYPDWYAELQQRFVSLPEGDGIRAWVVDLRDPFHPVAERYDSWPLADAACGQRILEVLAGMVGKANRIA